MNEKIETLKTLIEVSELGTQLKLNKIIQTLQYTEDPIKAKVLSDQILNNNFKGLEEKSIDDLIKAFSNEEKQNAFYENKQERETEKPLEDNKTETLAYELRTLNLKFEAMEYNYNKRIKELEEVNNKLVARLNITKNSKLIEVSDESINELYLRNLESEETEYKEAFIKDDIIVKSYYKLNKPGGNEKC